MMTMITNSDLGTSVKRAKTIKTTDEYVVVITVITPTAIYHSFLVKIFLKYGQKASFFVNYASSHCVDQ